MMLASSGSSRRRQANGASVPEPLSTSQAFTARRWSTGSVATLEVQGVTLLPQGALTSAQVDERAAVFVGGVERSAWVAGRGLYPDGSCRTIVWQCGVPSWGARGSDVAGEVRWDSTPAQSRRSERTKTEPTWNAALFDFTHITADWPSSMWDALAVPSDAATAQAWQGWPFPVTSASARVATTVAASNDSMVRDTADDYWETNVGTINGADQGMGNLGGGQYDYSATAVVQSASAGFTTTEGWYAMERACRAWIRYKQSFLSTLSSNPNFLQSGAAPEGAYYAYLMWDDRQVMIPDVTAWGDDVDAGGWTGLPSHQRTIMNAHRVMHHRLGFWGDRMDDSDVPDTEGASGPREVGHRLRWSVVGLMMGCGSVTSSGRTWAEWIARDVNAGKSDSNGFVPRILRGSAMLSGVTGRYATRFTSASLGVPPNDSTLVWNVEVWQVYGMLLRDLLFARRHGGLSTAVQQEIVDRCVEVADYLWPFFVVAGGRTSKCWPYRIVEGVTDPNPTDTSIALSAFAALPLAELWRVTGQSRFRDQAIEVLTINGSTPRDEIVGPALITPAPPQNVYGKLRNQVLHSVQHALSILYG
jgi:hypothetical protein